ncbi:MAG: FeoB small GTPase domain-containing protein, partial [Deferrisomatales bacterium]
DCPGCGSGPGPGAAPPDPGRPRRVALVGLPNTGKTQVFNNLTGDHALVANYPCTTLAVRRQTARVGDRPWEVIDTPGLHGLFIHSEEELVVRELLFSEPPDVVVQCVDANLLKQSLALTLDLLELQVPLVVCLNAVDETRRRGLWIDAGELSRRLGVPVVESVATEGIGTGALARALPGARRGRWEVRYGDLVERGLDRMAEALPPGATCRRKAASLLLLGDPFVAEWLQRAHASQALGALVAEAAEVRRAFQGNLGPALKHRRNAWVDQVYEAAVRDRRPAGGQLSDTLARLSRHPLWGLPILLGLVWAAFLLVVHVANRLADWMTRTLWEPVETLLAAWVPAGWGRELLIGDYGILSFGVANALLTVLPILSVFYLLYNAVEDTGYIPNASVMARRALDGLGLTGASIMPLVLAFGCKTVATMTARSLPSRKERYIAIYLIAFGIPCAAQTGLNMSILGRAGGLALVVAFGTLLLVEVLAGVVLNRLIPEDRRSHYVQYLPPLRLPSPRAVAWKTYYRLGAFLREALPVFVIAAAALFAVDAVGLLDAAKIVAAPVVQGFLGLPLDMVDALILCMARHEAAAALIIHLMEQGQLDWTQSVVAVTLTTMFVPCFANVVAMIKELGARAAVPMILVINASAFALAGALNWALVAARGLLGPGGP